jgi:hypothetical protein
MLNFLKATKYINTESRLSMFSPKAEAHTGLAYPVPKYEVGVAEKRLPSPLLSI